jgi:hypothetical protein
VAALILWACLKRSKWEGEIVASGYSLWRANFPRISALPSVYSPGPTSMGVPG